MCGGGPALEEALDETLEKARLPIDERVESVELCPRRGLDGDGAARGLSSVARCRQVAPNMAHVSLQMPEPDLRLDNVGRSEHAGGKLVEYLRGAIRASTSHL